MLYAKRAIAFLLALLMAVIPFFPASITHAADSLLDIQCISDQEHVGAGGTMSMHIIYHNVTNKNISKQWLKVKVPDGLEVDGLNGAEWSEKNRTIQWKVKDVKANGAGVIHFNLKVKANVKTNTEFGLSCQVWDGERVLHESKKIYIRVGSEIHQPFFLGYPDGKFHPKAYLTRAETAAIIARIKNLTGSPAKQQFKDVTASHWAYRYIHQVAKAGYMNGHNGYFDPDDPISRAELVTLVLRLRGVRAVPLESFPDAEKHWAGNMVATAKSLQFIDGINDHRFDPNGYTERQSAAKLINIALFRGPLVDGDIKVVQHFPDVPRSHWSFGWVEEASMVAHESIRRGRGVEHLIRYLPDQTERF